MNISIITPSYGQLDWLRLCIASVADQVGTQDEGWRKESKGEGQQSSAGVGGEGLRSPNPQSLIQNTSQSPLTIEHIIQDGGSPGIEEFAREIGVDLKSRYGADFVSDLEPFELLHLRTASGYTLRVFKEPDAGMYDAINKGIARMGGELWAWLNSDEQYLPGTLAFVSEWFARHPGVEVLCGDALLTDPEGNALAYRRIVRPRPLHTRLVHLGSLSCASFYRKGILTGAGCFDTRWRSIGDAEWMERVLKSGAVVRSCRRPLAAFAFTGRNTSESPLAKQEGREWRRGGDAPPAWMRITAILSHRCRKFVAGAYFSRSMNYAIHRGTKGRTLFHAAGIGWDWPSTRARPALLKGGRNCVQLIPADTTRVLGVPLMETSYDALASTLKEFVSVPGDGCAAVDFANTHVVTMRRHEAGFAELAGSLDLMVPDGMPLVWVMNAKGAGLRDRVYGPTFTRRFLVTCPERFTHYLVGGSEECGLRFRERMLALNPSLRFVGGYHGKCSADGVTEDEEGLVSDILEKRPDFIWVGLGTPKQYAWIHRIKPRLDHGILLAVGFAFDVNAGIKPDAPMWMQRLGLTWVYRMATEPRRLVGRYLFWNTLFLGYWILEWSGIHLRKIKLHLRNGILGFLDLFAAPVTDCVTGRPLGRAMIVGWGIGLRVIGHAGLPPLIPRFLPQKRLTYWKQRIGFTTPARPDFPRLGGITGNPPADSARVLNVVLTHLDGEPLARTIAHWKGICPEQDLWIAFGGKRRRFDRVGMDRAVFVGDPTLRREDNQREKQSYTGIFRAMAPVIEREKPDYVYLCEYDHVPLRPDLNAVQVAEITAEGADVMGHWLYRVDGTGHYHMLYHQSDPCFLPYWQSVSRREDKGVVLSMFGTGSLWSREAFLAVAAKEQEIECYLELYLPTLAHHLGFRLRCWNETRHMISNLPSRKWTIEEARKRNCLTIHPFK